MDTSSSPTTSVSPLRIGSPSAFPSLIMETPTSDDASCSASGASQRFYCYSAERHSLIRLSTMLPLAISQLPETSSFTFAVVNLTLSKGNTLESVPSQPTANPALQFNLQKSLVGRGEGKAAHLGRRAWLCLWLQINGFLNQYHCSHSLLASPAQASRIQAKWSSCLQSVRATRRRNSQTCGGSRDASGGQAFFCRRWQKDQLRS